MPTSVPVWVLILVAVLTGGFALAAQALSAHITRKSQRALFEAQEQKRKLERVSERGEELFTLMSHFFDEVHTSVVFYNKYHAGVMSPEKLRGQINAEEDNEKYKRLSVLIQLYFPDLAGVLKELTQSISKCQILLRQWCNDETKDIYDALQAAFLQMMKDYTTFRQAVSDKVN